MSIVLNKNVNNMRRSFLKFLTFIYILSAYLSLVFLPLELISNSSSLSFLEDFQNNTSCNLSLVSVSDVQCYGSNDGVITVEVDVWRVIIIRDV